MDYLRNNGKVLKYQRRMIFCKRQRIKNGEQKYFNYKKSLNTTCNKSSNTTNKYFLP
jgi:hypothetical protein